MELLYWERNDPAVPPMTNAPPTAVIARDALKVGGTATVPAIISPPPTAETAEEASNTFFVPVYSFHQWHFDFLLAIQSWLMRIKVMPLNILLQQQTLKDLSWFYSIAEYRNKLLNIDKIM